MVLNEIGTLHRDRGELDQAEACHQQALDLAPEIDSSWDEAHALAGVGRCAIASGRNAEGRTGLRHALKIFQRIGAPEASDISAELTALNNSGPVK
jgi:tetratricopeptide (TPR) repeat protein